MQPAHWYLTSALPRALHAALPLALLALALDRRARPLMFVALGFVLLYSNLPHKEVRFLFPVLPLWNAAAAVTLQRLWVNRGKSALRAALLAAAAAALAAGLGLTVITAAASTRNYPGGEALQALHRLAAADATAAAAAGRQLRVHIGVLPAMTGVSRYGEAGAPWSYSKEEGLNLQQLSARRFDFLLTDQPAVEGYSQLAAAEGFQRLALATRSPATALRGLLQGQLPVRLLTAPAVYVQRRQDLGAVPAGEAEAAAGQ